MVAETELPGY